TLMVHHVVEVIDIAELGTLGVGRERAPRLPVGRRREREEVLRVAAAVVEHVGRRRRAGSGLVVVHLVGHALGVGRHLRRRPLLAAVLPGLHVRLPLLDDAGVLLAEVRARLAALLLVGRLAPGRAAGILLLALRRAQLLALGDLHAQLAQLVGVDQRDRRRAV